MFKARETAPEQPPQSPNLANLLMKYLSVQREKSRKYSQRWQHAASIPARVGLANAGGEGQMAIAALGTAVAGSTVLANLPGVIGIPLMLLVGMICGALYAGVGVFLKQKLAMNEILTTILMNYVATYLISAMLFGSLRDPNGWNYPQTVEIAPQLRFHTRRNFL